MTLNYWQQFWRLKGPPLILAPLSLALSLFLRVKRKGLGLRRTAGGAPETSINVSLEGLQPTASNPELMFSGPDYAQLSHVILTHRNRNNIIVVFIPKQLGFLLRGFPVRGQH